MTTGGTVRVLLLDSNRTRARDVEAAKSSWQSRTAVGRNKPIWWVSERSFNKKLKLPMYKEAL